MDGENVSAFAAYQADIIEEPTPSVPDRSFRDLSRNEMIAHLISKKKQELKRKTREIMDRNPDKVPKRRKKAAAKSTPVSQNNSLSPKEPTLGNGTAAPKKDTAKKNKKGGAKSAPVSPKASPTSQNASPEQGKSAKKNKKSKAAVTDADVAGSAAKKSKPTLNLKIHPKGPLDLSYFISKGHKKNTSKEAVPTFSPKASVSENQFTDADQSVDFTNLYQSTPKPPNSPAANGGSSGKKKKNQSLHNEALRKSFSRTSQSINSDHENTVIYKQEPHSIVSNAEEAIDSLAERPLSDVSSIEVGKDLLSWVISPNTVDTFMANAWEKAPLLVERKCPTYYQELLSTAAFDRMLREHRVEFTKNLDITSYVDGVRTTHNPEGRAMPPTVWDFYASGCSIRLLNPQTFIPAIHSMNATLQEYFQCMTGTNVYLTPANSQGFAPHYDDIEAFVLQVEGKKHWKIYKPRTVDEQLPRKSSPNFTQAEIGKPIMDVILEAGDLLYFPRGYIHQASTVPGYHSLHITLSAYQKNSFGDLLEQLVPSMLQSAIASNVLLRQGLPPNIWQCMGLANNDDATPARLVNLKKIKACLDLTLKSFAQHVDDAVDQLAIKFQHDALPPYLTVEETARTVYGTLPVVTGGGEVVQPLVDLDTPVRLVRANVLRLVRHEEEEFRIYFHTENSKEYHQFEENFVEISAEHAPAVEYLIKAYPNFSMPKDLPIDEDESCLAVAQDLWERGILITQELLK